MNRLTLRVSLWLTAGCLWMHGTTGVAADAERVLAGTAPLRIEEPLDEVMVAGINRFCLRELAASPGRRDALWRRDGASIDASRQRFRQSIGAVDRRVTAVRPEGCGFELVSTLDRSSIVAQGDGQTVHAVRWRVLDGLTAEGLLVKPERVQAAVVALADADWTPEMFCGLGEGVPEQAQFVRRLAAAGCLVVLPALISRSDEFSGCPQVTYTNQSHREFVYRQAFEVGRHVIGYEVQKVLAAVDLLQHMKRPPEALPIGVAGIGEGGLLALYAAALDRRIASTLVCGYFQRREDVWKEPIYRNVWGLLTEFGDAELAGMIAPRRLVIEACRAVEVTGTPAARPGRRQSAAPGHIATNSLESVRAEFDRAAAIYKRLGNDSQIVLAVSGLKGDGAAGAPAAVAAFAAGLGLSLRDGIPPAWRPRDGIDAREREKRQFDEIQTAVQNLLRLSPGVRDDRWRADLSSVEKWLPSRNRLRDWVHDELIGRLPRAKLPFGARTRLVVETGEYLGYDVVLDVLPDVIASGVLLLPRGLRSGEKRPVVVCQHGLEGTPMDTIRRDGRAFRSYKAFSAELCRRGFIVYAPQNPYRGQDRFRSIQRKSNPLGRTLFSYIVAQHEQTLAWLATLPNVDAGRIAFYGLSYGGKTAMRVPPLVDRYCLSICSGDFTDWARVIATNEDRYGYIFTPEYEVPEWNMAHVAGYAELAMLMSPRPFMVEQGHRDGGTPTEWVAGEYGRVRRHYDFLKIGDRTEIEFFDGPHTINGQSTYRFLHRHLDWPEGPR